MFVQGTVKFTQYCYRRRQISQYHVMTAAIRQGTIMLVTCHAQPETAFPVETYQA